MMKLVFKSRTQNVKLYPLHSRLRTLFWAALNVLFLAEGKLCWPWEWFPLYYSQVWGGLLSAVIIRALFSAVIFSSWRLKLMCILTEPKCTACISIVPTLSLFQICSLKVLAGPMLCSKNSRFLLRSGAVNNWPTVASSGGGGGGNRFGRGWLQQW